MSVFDFVILLVCYGDNKDVGYVIESAFLYALRDARTSAPGAFVFLWSFALDTDLMKKKKRTG